MKYLYYIILGVVSYLIGNISSARIVAKHNHGDITKHGSGNPGTLNTWRAFGFWAGVITFLLDMIKGLIPTLAALLIFKHIPECSSEIATYVAGFSVVLGHIFPVVFKFKGGKGIATSVGVFLIINWWVALIAFVVMFVGMLFVKYASIFTIGFVVAMSIVEICLCNPANWVNYIFIGGILFLVLFAHRSNIKKLLTGKENKTELMKMLKGLANKKKVAKQQETAVQETNNQTEIDSEQNNSEEK